MSDNPEDQKRLKKALIEQLKRQQIEQQKKEILRKILEPGAYDRLSNIRLSNPELYSQLVNYLVALAQQNKLPRRITEQELLDMLRKITYKPETKLEYKRK